MKRISRIIVVLFLMMGFSACEELSHIANQTAQMLNLKNCTFNVDGINHITMLGIDLSKGMSQSSLNAAQLISVTNSIMNRRLPVSFNVNLDVNNPNNLAASMGKMDYIISLNNKEVISSTFSDGFSIPANSSGKVSIPISTDLFQLFSGETADAILNLAFKLAGAQSNPVNLGVKVKPYIKVNNKTLAYPDYITINKVLE